MAEMVRKYSVFVDWFVQRDPNATMVPMEDAREMLHQRHVLREAGFPVLAGVMRLVIVTATGERVAIDTYPIDDRTGHIVLPISADATLRRMLWPFSDALERALPPRTPSTAEAGTVVQREVP
jgi:hypothetical protein